MQCMNHTWMACHLEGLGFNPFGGKCSAKLYMCPNGLRVLVLRISCKYVWPNIMHSKWPIGGLHHSLFWRLGHGQISRWPICAQPMVIQAGNTRVACQCTTSIQHTISQNEISFIFFYMMLASTTYPGIICMPDY